MMYYLYYPHAVALGSISYLQGASVKYSEEYLNKTGDIVDKNQLLIVKDALNLCMNSIKTSHKFEKKYCDYAVLLFDKRSYDPDTFKNELVDVRAYEQMVIGIDADIRSLEYKSLVKRHGRLFYDRVLDLLFSPFGMTVYFSITVLLLSFPVLLFYMVSKNNKKSAI